MEKINLTQERLKELFLYDPDSGFFFRRKKSGRITHNFMLAGYKNSNGYILFGVDYNTYRAHRLAWLYINGELPDGDIDHINHIRTDNSFANLRLVNRSENLKNSSKNKKNKSGTTGVRFNNIANKWTAYIAVNMKSVHLGNHEKIETAIMIRKAAEGWYGFHNNHGSIVEKVKCYR